MMSIKKTLLQIMKNIYRVAATIWLRGDTLVCPCCDGRFREFLSAGKPKRKNAQCPQCGSLERHRLFWLYLKNKTSFFTTRLRVLDIAPVEFLQNKFKKLPNIHYLGTDLESPLAMIKMDITAMSIKDSSFDSIICYHVLEHIPDDIGAMRELFRVLKPGGWGILQSPMDVSKEKTFEDPAIVLPSERERYFGQNDHVRVYGRDYEDRLRSVGFIVSKDRYFFELDNATVQKYGLSLAEDEKEIYVCSRP